MKTKEHVIKDFHAVPFFRKIKEQIAEELEGKTFEQKKELLRKYRSGELKLKVVPD
jgi:hypothetical protein